MKKKKRKIKYQNILAFFLFVYLIIFLIVKIINKNITNIYIINNNYLSDQMIIDIAGINNYPKTFIYTSNKIRRNLENDINIKSAKVYKKNLTEVYIEIIENRPLFYSVANNKTVLMDQSEVDIKYEVPILINYVPDVIYEEFKEQMSLINENVIKRISEIKYDPNEVDDERFSLSMIDGNYVYLTLNKYNKLNNYIEIIKKFNEKGILYLDSGEYFEIKKN